MNEEEGKEVTVEFLLNHLAVEDGNSQHRFLSQLDSNTSVNMVAYDRRQNKGKSNRANNNNGREREQNKSRAQTSSSTAQTSRKPPGMEGKCVRCGRPEHEQGEKCPAKNAKCKDCHKIGHFYKVCQSSKRTRRANLAQVTPQEEKDNTFIDECGCTQMHPSCTQPKPPAVNMVKVINHTGTTKGSQGQLKFPIDVEFRGQYKHHLEVRVDTGADVNCMNEKTFRRLFPKVELSVCPHSIKNFGNSTADIYILGQFCTFLKFRGIHSAIHAPQQEVNTCNTCTDWVHSNREHTGHLPAHMEVCDHLAQVTEKTQEQHTLPDLTHNLCHDVTHRHAEFPSDMESSPNFLGKQFLQGKEENQTQGNEKNVDTRISGNTTPNRHSMLSTYTHSREVSQNFQQLEMESSNTVALPCFNPKADAATHLEIPNNVHNNERYPNMNANMDTNHMAHRYRHTELRPFKAMAHRHTEKEAHLLSGPYTLQPEKEAHLLSRPSELQAVNNMK